MATTTGLINQLIGSYTDLKQYFQHNRADIDATVAAAVARLDASIQNAAASLPVSPNMLADAKHWSSLCGGEINVPHELFEAHSNSLFSAGFNGGAAGNGTVEVVSLDQLAAQGIPHGGDLIKACKAQFLGAEFNVLLFDVSLTSLTGVLHVINQGCPRFTGWSRGEFITQSVCFINVIEQSGDIVFYPHNNMPAIVDATADDAGKGWIYKHNHQTGWGGCHQPQFTGTGHMKVAIALPYIGFGDHKGKFIFANSVGRYSHGGDYIPDGHSY